MIILTNYENNLHILIIFRRTNKNLSQKGIEIIPAGADLSEAELIDQLKDKDGIIIGGSEIVSEKVISACPKLKYILFFGTNYQKNVDVNAAKRQNIIITNTPHANAYSVAEFTVAHILNSKKFITYLNNSTKAGNWERMQTKNLEKKTLGIIGMGHIGSIVAKIMTKGFGMKVMYYSRTRKEQLEKELSLDYTSLEEVLTHSDIVSLHIPYQEETKEFISEKEFQLMKNDAVLINMSRAEVVNGTALFLALTTNRLALAAFDVYYQEPAPTKENDQYKLLSLPDNKFIITPHTAYNTVESIDAMNAMILQTLEEIKSNHKPKYAI